MKPKSKFNIGDRVRVIQRNSFTRDWVGKIGKISGLDELSGYPRYWVKYRKDVIWFYPFEIEKVEKEAK